MASALGQLPNAPLIYVLAQIVFTRIPKMESRWEDFHQEIFDLYPQAEPERIRQVQIQDEGVSSASDLIRWNMFDRDRRTGIILSPESLVFHATSYTTSDDFFNNLDYIINKLVDILPKNIEVNRLGLRYVDLLLPSKEIPVDNQVSGKLGSISLEEVGCNFQKLEEVTRYKTPLNGDLVIRHRQSIEADILPGDIFPNNLLPAPLLANVKPEEAVVGLIDYDHYIKVKEDFEPISIIKKFKELHHISSKAFELTTTDEAKQLWRGTT
ncbi:MAG: TIGR04255 family protein [Gammaproteobacteria bacterium]|nr:TIGR04255 family protein [Gammaproteobacteria bacterium]MCW8987614.1 TIGR04255 family protein [Gammaproteobacteria bacterium]